MHALYGILLVVIGVTVFFTVLQHDGLEAPQPSWWSGPVGWGGLALALAGVGLIVYNIYTVLRSVI